MFSAMFFVLNGLPIGPPSLSPHSV